MIQLGIKTDGGDDIAFDSNAYITSYRKENYDQITIKIPKGRRKQLHQIAQEKNITDKKGQVSVSRLIVNCLEEKYQIDLSTKLT